jgi:sensor c-di-GMP phosphodiesterase-like protein
VLGYDLKTTLSNTAYAGCKVIYFDADLGKNIEYMFAVKYDIDPEKNKIYTLNSRVKSGQEAKETAMKKLRELKDFGIRISMDDFGQGYSSLTYLRKLPIDTLKIDKAFIDDIFKDDSNNQIVYSIVELAHRMQLKVNAEGVETEDQMNYLRHVDCDSIQGYLISRPVPEAEVLNLLQKFGTIKK